MQIESVNGASSAAVIALLSCQRVLEMPQCTLKWAETLVMAPTLTRVHHVLYSTYIYVGSYYYTMRTTHVKVGTLVWTCMGRSVVQSLILALPPRLRYVDEGDCDHEIGNLGT